jgi:hypothetical protein
VLENSRYSGHQRNMRTTGRQRKGYHIGKCLKLKIIIIIIKRKNGYSHSHSLFFLFTFENKIKYIAHKNISLSLSPLCLPLLCSFPGMILSPAIPLIAGESDGRARGDFDHVSESSPSRLLLNILRCVFGVFSSRFRVLNSIYLF